MTEAANDATKPPMGFDKSSLSLVLTYSDGKTSEVRMLAPVMADGTTPDVSRKPRFFSTISINFPGRSIPWVFEIPADNLEAALDMVVEEGMKAGKTATEKIIDDQRRAMLMGGAPGSPVARPN